MRFKGLLVALLVLLPGLAVAQQFIRYYPPDGVSTSTSTPGFSYASNVGSLVNAGTAGTPVPQQFNVYNFCDGAACVTGYQRLQLGFTSSIAFIGTAGAGTGAGGNLLFQTAGSNRFILTDTAFAPYASGDAMDLGTTSLTVKSAFLSRSIQGSKSKTLTDAAAAVSFVRIAVPTNGYIGGKVIATANSTDGTNRLTTTSEWYFAGADTAGTVTCGAPSAVGTPSTAYRRGNTLVCTLTSVTSTTNCDLQVTCTDNLAGDQTPVFEWRLDMPSPATVTPQ